jgi:hypoxanthine phosphoribosyltransferase
MSEQQRRTLFEVAAIAERVRDLGRQINGDYPDGNLLIVGILKGSFIFMADLVRCLSVPCQIDFARISSYGSGTCSSGSLDIKMDIAIPVQDRNVILVDDIVDTGLTLCQYRERIARDHPRSLKIAAMINKTGRREKHVHVDYCGFEIEGGFLVGYGLDCDEQFRHLGTIDVLEEI